MTTEQIGKASPDEVVPGNLSVNSLAEGEQGGGEKSIDELMNNAVAQRMVLSQILAFCISPKSASEINDLVQRVRSTAYSVFSSATLCQWLEEYGGLRRALETEDEKKWQTTEKGRDWVRSHDRNEQLRQMLQKVPEHRPLYIKLMEFCLTPRGRAEIEQHIGKEIEHLSPRIYASAFIGELEEAGGLHWEGKWKTTETGQQFCKQENVLIHCDSKE